MLCWLERQPAHKDLLISQPGLCHYSDGQYLQDVQDPFWKIILGDKEKGLIKPKQKYSLF